MFWSELGLLQEVLYSSRKKLEKIMYMYLEIWFWICSFKYIFEIQFVVCRFGKHYDNFTHVILGMLSWSWYVANFEP
jgi:hypothetical protein